MIRLQRFFPIAILAAVCAAEAQAPEQPVPTLSLSTRTVLVPVMASRSNGAAVRDLGAGDFRVYDNGKLQRIASFEQIGDATEANSPVAHETEPHFAIVLLDALNTSFSDQAFAKDAVEHLLDYFPPGERIALFALSDQLKCVHDFSSNPESLRSALRGFSAPTPIGGSPSALSSSYSAATSYSSLAAFSNLAQTRETGSGPEALYYQRRRIEQTFDALATIARIMKTLPGRKDLLWVSSAFPLTIYGRNGASDAEYYQNQANEAARALSSAGLRVYPIDARGLLTSADAYINIATMQQFADSTGGEAFFNSNGLTSLMRRALEDAREGYVLTYSPSDLHEDGSFHTIRVQVSRAQVKLRYRPGYYADSPPRKGKRQK